MSQEFNKVAFEKALVVTMGWNFDLAVEKLLEIKAGDWTEVRAEKAVLNYQRYMAVTKALGGLQLVPNADIDEIWHMHILDTRAYATDCEALFGELLHHYPYFGMLGEDNKKQWLQVQDGSENLWQELFGEQLYGTNNEPQKCPQVCPCHMDEITITASALTAFQKRA